MIAQASYRAFDTNKSYACQECEMSGHPKINTHSAFDRLTLARFWVMSWFHHTFDASSLVVTNRAPASENFFEES